jgi:hypothetical protein
MWECTHQAVGCARRSLSLRIRTLQRRSGLPLDSLAIAHSLWALDSTNCVRSPTIEDLVHGTSPDGLAASVTESLCSTAFRHTLDTSGLYADRAGFFSAGWPDALCALGLDPDTALDTLANMALLLAGDKGTITIWDAFTSSLHTTCEIPPCLVVPPAPWRSELIRQLAEYGSLLPEHADDAASRALATMATRVMTQCDGETFMFMISSWLDPDCDPDSRALAEDLPEMILLALAEVQSSRRSRGLKAASLHDRLRAEKRLKGITTRPQKRPKATPRPTAPGPGSGPATRPAKAKARGRPRRRSPPPPPHSLEPAPPLTAPHAPERTDSPAPPAAPQHHPPPQPPLLRDDRPPPRDDLPTRRTRPRMGPLGEPCDDQDRPLPDRPARQRPAPALPDRPAKRTAKQPRAPTKRLAERPEDHQGPRTRQRNTREWRSVGTSSQEPD